MKWWRSPMWGSTERDKQLRNQKRVAQTIYRWAPLPERSRVMSKPKLGICCNICGDFLPWQETQSNENGKEGVLFHRVLSSFLGGIRSTTIVIVGVQQTCQIAPYWGEIKRCDPQIDIARGCSKNWWTLKGFGRVAVSIIVKSLPCFSYVKTYHNILS